MLSVLIADDQLPIADVREEKLVANGYDVSDITSNVDSAVVLGELHKPDLAVLCFSALGWRMSVKYLNADRRGWR